MKTMRKIHESSAQQLSNTVKLLKMQLVEKHGGIEVNNNKVDLTVEHDRRGVAIMDDTQSKYKIREGDGQGEKNLGIVDDARPWLGKEVDCEHDVYESARQVSCEVVNGLVVKVVEI